ncbi:3-hydroxypropionyl-coenzyme A dehydratase (3-hydroxypropionyl-CoA dehydratase) [Durusdinium trenchii]|uniref:3-hydroxypropionyl-coenzyme A dehydratase (3-hydroxypropionyl-CoA dehydratase) n=1 Tax=Durusdinium trenchii TaxID=1381693 RepID=A0ABP0J5E0_9DINO
MAPQLVSLEEARALGLGVAKSTSAASEFETEREGLKAFGVELSKDHLEGYKYKLGSKVERDLNLVKRPWEVPIIDQLGPETVSKNKDVETWDNPEFLLEIREGIAYCTLNRPDANNAMNDGIGGGLHDALRILRERPEIRIAVFTGNGRMFCAGGDPKSFQAAQKMAGAISGDGDKYQGPPAGPMIAGTGTMIVEGNKMSAQGFARDMYSMSSLPQFTICLMNGSAMGGGFGLVCACDYVIATKQAHATLSEVKLGVIPAVISPHVSRTIGTANCKRLFCTAENANMQTAMEIGLVHKIVDHPRDFQAAVREVATKIQLLAPGAVGATKQVLLDCLNQPISNSLIEYTAKEYLRVRRGKECEEGMEAYKNKQRPPWVQKVIGVKESEES